MKDRTNVFSMIVYRIILYIAQEGRISATRPSITFTQISQIIEKEMGGLGGEIYSLFFYAIAKVRLSISFYF